MLSRPLSNRKVSPGTGTKVTPGAMGAMQHIQTVEELANTVLEPRGLADTSQDILQTLNTADQDIIKKCGELLMFDPMVTTQVHDSVSLASCHPSEMVEICAYERAVIPTVHAVIRGKMSRSPGKRDLFTRAPSSGLSARLRQRLACIA